jgi:hypothetical protein
MDWHYGSENFPSELYDDNAGTHIGMFIAWVIKRDLIGELHLQESVESISKVKSRQMTGTEFLKLECDEKFWEDDLNDKGNAFAKYYYGANMYYDDYGSILSDELPSVFHVIDSWGNYEKLALKLDEQFKNWQETVQS